MKLFLTTVVVIVSCLLFIAGSTGQETTTTARPLADEVDNTKNARFFFNFNSDPCTNTLYQMLNMSDAKCSLQCYLQAGYQQGGYCDNNNVCQCNVIA